MVLCHAQSRFPPLLVTPYCVVPSSRSSVFGIYVIMMMTIIQTILKVRLILAFWFVVVVVVVVVVIIIVVCVVCCVCVCVVSMQLF